MNALSYNRTILALTGADALSFLQGITTSDVTEWRESGLCFTAFLSPQGKLLYDAFAWRTGDTLLLDCDADAAPLLQTHLLRHRLRATVSIEQSDLALSLYRSDHTTGFADPRSESMPRRAYTLSPSATANTLSAEEYHTQRLTHGLPEAAYDTHGSDVAMDMGYDAFGAISFTKGCYIGQEVTARMYYKQIVRKSLLCVTSMSTLHSNEAFTPITCGALTLGTLRSNQENQGLALITLDALEHATLSSASLLCGAQAIKIQWPEWAATRHEQWRQGKLAAQG
jgi:tRNA-modifying protein YgfZ